MGVGRARHLIMYVVATGGSSVPVGRGWAFETNFLTEWCVECLFFFFRNRNNDTDYYFYLGVIVNYCVSTCIGSCSKCRSETNSKRTSPATACRMLNNESPSPFLLGFE